MKKTGYALLFALCFSIVLLYGCAKLDFFHANKKDITDREERNREEKKDIGKTIEFQTSGGVYTYTIYTNRPELYREYEHRKLNYQDMNYIMKSLKEEWPEKFPLFVRGKDITEQKDLSSIFIKYSCPWKNIVLGVFMDPDENKIVNLYETEEYYEFIRQMRYWYELQYVYDEAAKTDITWSEALETGEICGYMWSSETDGGSSYVPSEKEEVFCNIKNTMKEFLPGLESGTLINVDAEYKSFLHDMKIQDIGELINENNMKLSYFKFMT